MSETRKKKIAVILAGCGVYDGAEIHEAVLTLLYIDKAGAEAVCFAPNIPQAHVINHLTGETTAESRNVLTEAARIARGKIADLATFDAAAVDAVILPGGFGAVKNLSDYAFKGVDCTVNPDVEKALRAMRAANKPIGALCIAPVILVKLFGDVDNRIGGITVGEDQATCDALIRMGAAIVTTSRGYQRVTNDEKKIVTSPAYMLDRPLAEIAEGIEGTVKNLLEWAK
ncbi:isoprenoid biosynthesis glyoxalase ElbB [bacterium]|nr:isoprenoid biosynthesis glyoxalase ElbB [bacterium]